MLKFSYFKRIKGSDSTHQGIYELSISADAIVCHQLIKMIIFFNPPFWVKVFWKGTIAPVHYFDL